MHRLVCIGGSTGAPVGLADLLTALPEGFPAPILVALHMPAAMTSSFVRTLKGRGPLRPVVAENGMLPEPGTVCLGPGGLHIGVGGTGRVVLSPKPTELHFKPSIDVLFHTVARAVRSSTVAVVLTGLSAKKDAVEGARAVRQVGGTVLVIDDPSSRFLGMPKNVIDAGAASRVVLARDMPSALVSAAG